MPALLHIFFWVPGNLLGYAAAFPLSGLTVNSHFHLEPSAPSSPKGFQQVYKSEDFEVVIQGTVLATASMAKQKAQMGLANIQNLYKPHGNPYEGQVSDLIACAPDLLPKINEIHVAGETAALLVGGATERKMFGACTKDQVAYWAGYFQFYYEPQNMAVEVRVFEKKKGTLAGAQTHLKHVSETLFSKTGNPL